MEGLKCLGDTSRGRHRRGQIGGPPPVTAVTRFPLASVLNSAHRTRLHSHERALPLFSLSRAPHSGPGKKGPGRQSCGQLQTAGRGQGRSRVSPPPATPRPRVLLCPLFPGFPFLALDSVQRTFSFSSLVSADVRLSELSS